MVHRKRIAHRQIPQSVKFYARSPCTEVYVKTKHGMPLREKNKQQNESAKLPFNCGDAEKCTRIFCFRKKFLFLWSRKIFRPFFCGHKKWAAKTTALTTINSRHCESNCSTAICLSFVQINDKPIKITEMIWHRIELRFNCSAQFVFFFHLLFIYMNVISSLLLSMPGMISTVNMFILSLN